MFVRDYRALYMLFASYYYPRRLIAPVENIRSEFVVGVALSCRVV